MVHIHIPPSPSPPPPCIRQVSWTCPGCLVDRSIELTICSSCNITKDGSIIPKEDVSG